MIELWIEAIGKIAAALNADRHSTRRIRTADQKRLLRGGRPSRNAMKPQGIHRGRRRWKGYMACNLLRFGNQVKARNGQSWCVKHLANGANALRSVGVLVKKGETRGDIQHRRAAQ
jgi:hypothetical protein